MNNLFNNFTNMYSLVKTLRFELVPEPVTKLHFKTWLKEIKDNQINHENMFAKDKSVNEAYKAVKKILDNMHEEYINISLGSDLAKRIDISNYYKLKYEDKTSIVDEEEKLRNIIGASFRVAEEYYIKLIKKNNNKIKESKDEETILTDSKIIDYIISNKNKCIIESVTDDEFDNIREFKGFFGYLDKYNQNRNNYYKYKKESSGSVAERIVGENLPIFCDNCTNFIKNKNEYLDMYTKLKNENIELVCNSFNGEKIEIKDINVNLFELNYFKYCLSQKEIEIYNDGIGQANFLINQYNLLFKDKNCKLNSFSRLKKQIGCGIRKKLFLMLEADTESELSEKSKENSDILSLEKLLNVIADSVEKYLSYKSKCENNIYNFIDFIKQNNTYEGLYFNKKAVDYLSNKYFSNWHVIKDKLRDRKEWTCINKNSKDEIQINDAVELSPLFSILNIEKDATVLFKNSIFNNTSLQIDLNQSNSEILLELIINDVKKNLHFIHDNLKNVLNITNYRQNDEIDGEYNSKITLIKNWLDAIKGVLDFVKFFDVKRNKVKGMPYSPILSNFVDDLLYSNDTNWSKWYDAVRNYLTKNDEDDIKNNMLKLNFDSSQLLQGWSDGQEKIKKATILKYNGEVYLGILKDNYLFDKDRDDNKIYKVSDNCGYKLCIKNIKFKTIAGKGFKSKYGQSYADWVKEDPFEAIKALQNHIKTDYLNKYPNFESIIKTEYDNKSTFMQEINAVLNECYENEFIKIDWNMILETEKTGGIYLFKIKTKDYRQNSHGKKDLQTIYWEDVLSKDSFHQLCAGGQIFLRESLGERPKIVHKKGSILVNRRLKSNDIIPNDIYKKIVSIANSSDSIDIVKEKVLKAGILAKNLNIDNIGFKVASHDIKKDNRFYGEEKYLFYCPIRLNYNAKQYNIKNYDKAANDINKKVNDIFCNENKYYIGIDRGEKNLIYVAILDSNSKMVIPARSLNIINNTDYLFLLKDKADNRIREKQSWQKISNISKLKEGYISNTIHEIVKLILQYPSYITLEDLSRKFKQNRIFREQSVYQNFEVALAKKLNFIVDKNAENSDLLTIKKALQLTPPISNYKNLEHKKQFGIMMYTHAKYTSVTDPVTGWRKTIYISKGSEVYLKNKILGCFEDIAFDGNDYYFEYKDINTNKLWRLYSSINGKSLPRFRNKEVLIVDKNIWQPEQIDIVKILDMLFIGFDKSKSLKQQLENGQELKRIEGQKVTAWESLRFAIDIIQQIRNDGIDDNDKNFIFSPVRDKNGKHFDSREQDNSFLPKDADANGAYNIAMKGIIMDEHIKYCCNNNIDNKKINLFISDEEWDLWLADKKEWKKRIGNFAIKSK